MSLLLSLLAMHFADAHAAGQAAYEDLRRDMVDRRLPGVHDARVLDALRRVPRHRFVPDDMRSRAYEDNALAIGRGQTISQPLVVATMTEQLALTGAERVLEVGTGSGYQAAVLAELAGEVFTVEVVPELAAAARRTLDSLGYGNVNVRQGDGRKGWPEQAPFDGILVAAAAQTVPAALLAQLKDGGRMVIPLGDPDNADLVLLKKTATGISRRALYPVRFVPLVGS